MVSKRAFMQMSALLCIRDDTKKFLTILLLSVNYTSIIGNFYGLLGIHYNDNLHVYITK